jgi:hypothetical protein
MSHVLPAPKGAPPFGGWLRGLLPTFAGVPKPLLQALRFGFVAALLAYLTSCLISVGWAKIWAALPESWLFYALLPVSCLILPFADMVIYRRIWRTGPRLGLPTTVRKNVLNSALFDLSGETYLVVWAKKNLALPFSFLCHSIKDNVVLSAIAGWGALLGLLAWLTLSGHLMVPLEADGFWIYVAGGGLLLILCAALFLSRNAIAVLSNRQIAFAFAVHCLRVGGGHAVMVALWSLALPSVPLVVWLNFLVIRIMATRLGFLPQRDLLVLSAGLSVSAALGLPPAGIAAVLLIITASEHLLNLMLLGTPAVASAVRVLSRPKPVA